MADSKRTEVTVAHRTFWYIDADEIHRFAIRGETIEVNDEDLARGQKYSAFVKPGEDVPESPAAVVEPSDPGDAPESDKVDDIKTWVGGDPAKAQEALTTELEKDEADRRSTLVEHLEKLVGGQ